MIAFGPIPSRRLGRSLGINNIPPKICTYSCIYCQVACQMKMRIERQPFYPPEDVFHAVAEKVDEAKALSESIDYLTFVPDGETTLDINLGHAIDLLKSLGIRIAVITNSSLIWRPDVQSDLHKTDWISFKIDAVEEEIWRKIDRPSGRLKLDQILEGILEFAEHYQGKLVTETMLAKGVNDSEENLEGVARFLEKLKPDIAYLSIPIRPPAEKYVEVPDEKVVIRSFEILNESNNKVEYLIGYEGNTFAFTGNAEEDMLSITAVHPMREDGVREFLGKAQAGWGLIDQLIDDNKLAEVSYNGHKFYIRKFQKTHL
ncbi:MAG: radical SAM protein [Balneolaceae bacterium]